MQIVLYSNMVFLLYPFIDSILTFDGGMASEITSKVLICSELPVQAGDWQSF